MMKSGHRYAPELFQLFDLRDQTLWKKYYDFNKEYVRLYLKILHK